MVPHPRAEPPRPIGHGPWNSGSVHRRKFLECSGQLVAGNGRSVETTLRFWGEYEPPTESVAAGAPGGSPRCVHRITAWPPALDNGYACGAGGCGQNTDPWVFSPGFVWTICRHHVKGRLRPAIRKLAPGDVVLFGSAVPSHEAWLLDTVLVVADGQAEASPPEVVSAACSDALYRVAVLDRLAGSEDAWRPIRGRAAGAPGGGAFSFAPCMNANKGAPTFERPNIASLVKGLSRQAGEPVSIGATQALAVARYREGAAAFWHEVVALVRKDGLHLGTRFDIAVAPPGPTGRPSRK